MEGVGSSFALSYIWCVGGWFGVISSSPDEENESDTDQIIVV